MQKITGLATKDELNTVINILEQIEGGILDSARLWGDGTRSLAAAFELSKPTWTMFVLY